MSEQILEKLIKKVAKLPGLGPRSSRRIVLHLLKDKETLLLPIIEDMSKVCLLYTSDAADEEEV